MIYRMLILTLGVGAVLLSACDPELLEDLGNDSNASPSIQGGETAVVTNVIDGDTIDVEINGTTYRVRYVGVNTPERDEACYSDAKDANSRMVRGKTVLLVQDTSDTDQYGRLLRYIYVNGVFVNQKLIQDGWGEVVLYPPDDGNYDNFLALERQAADDGLGCHPTGIFDDGNYRR